MGSQCCLWHRSSESGPCTVVVLGEHNVGKRSLAARFERLSGISQLRHDSRSWRQYMNTASGGNRTPPLLPAAVPKPRRRGAPPPPPLLPRLPMVASPNTATGVLQRLPSESEVQRLETPQENEEASSNTKHPVVTARTEGSLALYEQRVDVKWVTGSSYTAHVHQAMQAGHVPFTRNTAYVLMFAVNDRASFDAIPKMVAALTQHLHAMPPVLVLGNKADVPSGERCVSRDEVEEFTVPRGLLYLETALTKGFNGRLAVEVAVSLASTAARSVRLFDEDAAVAAAARVYSTSQRSSPEQSPQSSPRPLPSSMSSPLSPSSPPPMSPPVRSSSLTSASMQSLQYQQQQQQPFRPTLAV